MPKRVAAVDDQTLLREVGHLSDEILLLPRQVAFLTGLSVDMLAERMRTRPPKPPYPEPPEKPRAALWYSLGAVPSLPVLAACPSRGRGHCHLSAVFLHHLASRRAGRLVASGQAPLRSGWRKPPPGGCLADHPRGGADGAVGPDRLADAGIAGQGAGCGGAL